jgi:hypothetical protein
MVSAQPESHEDPEVGRGWRFWIVLILIFAFSTTVLRIADELSAVSGSAAGLFSYLLTLGISGFFSRWLRPMPVGAWARPAPPRRKSAFAVWPQRAME